MSHQFPTDTPPRPQPPELAEPQPRDWWCNTCGAHAESLGVPEGWWALTKRCGDHYASGRPYLRRHGVFCTTQCLATQLPRLGGGG
jgi:hypothetical protein